MIRLKKIFLTAAAIITLLLLAGYAYLQFRKHDSFKVHIHKEASLLLKVNVDGLLFEMGYSSKQDKKNVPRGLSVPANVFIYNLRTKSPLTFFGALPVKDTVELKHYLSKVINISVTRQHSDGEWSGHSKDGRLTVLYNSTNIAFAYSIVKEKVKDILEDVLKGQHLLNAEDRKFKQLKNSNAHFSYTDGKYSGTGNITNNMLVMNGSLPIEQLDVPDKSITTVNMLSTSALKIWLNADLKKLSLHKKIALKHFVLPLDSVADHYRGYAALELGNYTIQESQEVTYDYNDDFEKVEQVKIKKVKVPEFMAVVMSKADPMIHYLQKNGLIANGMVHKELFPLYDVYTKKGGTAIYFSTAKINAKSPSALSTPYFFSAAIDFNQIRIFNQFPIIESYIKPFQQLKVKARKQDNETGKFDLELRLQNSF